MRETTDLHLSPSLRALALAILGSATVLAVAQAQTTQPTTRPAAWHFLHISFISSCPWV